MKNLWIVQLKLVNFMGRELYLNKVFEEKESVELCSGRMSLRIMKNHQESQSSLQKSAQGTLQ